MATYRTQINPVTASAVFCEADNFSAGRAKSPRPATTRAHFIIGAQKNTASQGCEPGMRASRTRLGPAGWFINARNRFPNVADAMVLNRFRWTKRSGLKKLGKDSFRSPRRLPGLGQGGFPTCPDAETLNGMYVGTNCLCPIRAHEGQPWTAAHLCSWQLRNTRDLDHVRCVRGVGLAASSCRVQRMHQLLMTKTSSCMEVPQMHRPPMWIESLVTTARTFPTRRWRGRATIWQSRASITRRVPVT